eukprot:4166898-Pyramimonas_sp.AAC.1
MYVRVHQYTRAHIYNDTYPCIRTHNVHARARAHQGASRAKVRAACGRSSKDQGARRAAPPQS